MKDTRWVLLGVEKVGLKGQFLWFAEATLPGESDWVMPQVFTGVGRDKYEAMWNLGKQMNACGVADA